MDDNLYDRPTDDAPPSEEHGDQPQESGSPSLLNKESWPDAKPGMTKTFKCLKVMENEIEIVASEEEGEPGEADAAQAPMPEEISMMA